MGTKLFSFIYHSIRKRVNDPGNATYWLPKTLQNLDDPDGSGKLLPLRGTDWQLGSITGAAGTTFQNAIKGQWWLNIGAKHRNDPELVKHEPIACPDNPWPRLSMPEVQVHGLDNVWVLDNPVVNQPGTGYTTVMTLQFGYYDGRNGRPKLSGLQVNGQCSLHQGVCSAAAAAGGEPPSRQCDGWVPDEDIHGVGEFQVTLTDMMADATVDIRVVGAGPERQLDISVSDIRVRGKDGGPPNLTVDDLTVDTSWTWMSNSIWLPQARRALESDDGRMALIHNLNAILNEPDHRRELSRLMNAQFKRILDDNLGQPPAGALPSDGKPAVNPADQYLFDRFRASLNTPGSDYYLPKVVARDADPRLEPFRVDQIDLGNGEFGGFQLQELRLHQVTIVGLSDAVAPPGRMSLDANGMTATLQLSTLNPPPLAITGQFSMKLRGDETELGGSFTIHVSKSEVFASMTATGEELAELDIQFYQLKIGAALDNIKVKVEIDSAFKDVVNQIFNQDQVKQQVLDGINDKAAGNLDAISQAATDGAQKLISAKLDG